MATAQELKVIVTLEDQRARQGLSRLDKSVNQTDKSFQSLGKSLKFVAGAAITGVAVRGFARIAKSSVDAAADAAEAFNATNVVFGDSVEILREFGKTSIKQAGLSETAFNKLSIGIGSLLKNAGLPLDEVANKTVDLTKRAADLASVFNTDVQDASIALGAALRGETEPARRFGVTLSDAAVQAEALSSGLVKTKGEITEQVKIQARYALILKQSEQVAGDFVNTQESFANQAKIAGENITDLKEALGNALLPSATTVLSKGINPLIEGLTKFINKSVIASRATKVLAKAQDDWIKEDFETVIENSTNKLASLNSEARFYNEQIRRANEEQAKFGDVTGTLGTKIANAREALSGINQELRTQERIVTDAKKGLAELESRYDSINTEVDTSATVNSENNAATEEAIRLENLLFESRQNNLISLSMSRQKTAELADEQEKLNEKTLLATAIQQEYAGIVTSTFNELGQSIVESGASIATVYGALASGAKNAIAVILDALAQQAAAQAAVYLGIGLATKDPTQFAAAGQLSGAAALAATAAGIVRALPIPELAEGGIIPPTPGGRIVRVAEAGQAEAIVPLDKAGFGGGQTIVIVNNANTNIAGNLLTTQQLANEVTGYQRMSARGY